MINISETQRHRARYVRTVLAWHDLTQSDLGRLLGISQQAAGRKLKGLRAFKDDELLTIADAFGIPPGHLLRPPPLDEILGPLAEPEPGLLSAPKYSPPQVRGLIGPSPAGEVNPAHRGWATAHRVGLLRPHRRSPTMDPRRERGSFPEPEGVVSLGYVA